MIIIDPDNIWNDIQKIKSMSPLVHNITNFVTMDIMANSLLAIGASPIMAHAHEEIEQITKSVQAININIGTLEEYWIKTMIQVAVIAKDQKIPIVLDPVGAGFTKYRTQITLELLNTRAITVIRGNSSEILSLVHNKIITKGVDSNEENINDTLGAAKYLSKKFNMIVVVTGKVDYIIENEKVIKVEHGHLLMSKVTGMGCTLSSIIAAFLSINSNYFAAIIHAVTMFDIIGELVANDSVGPASFKTNFIDKLYNITLMDIKNILQNV
ncbi:MAG: hydroxyethylthiazole kinase [Rickettsiales endosymbiont of Dermacentor nuttalli]